MKKNFGIGMLFGALIVVLIVIALGAIYDYNENLAKVIWPDSRKFTEIPIHEESIFDENIIGAIPAKYIDKTHVCELLPEGRTPYEFSGIFTYDFDVNRWIYCQ